MRRATMVVLLAARDGRHFHATAGRMPPPPPTVTQIDLVANRLERLKAKLPPF